MTRETFTVECIRYGQFRDEEESAFATMAEAREFGRRMLHAHYRVWINDVEIHEREFGSGGGY